MIRITDQHGGHNWIGLDQIERIEAAPKPYRERGIHALLHLTGGLVFEAREFVYEIERAIKQARREGEQDG